MPEEPITEGEDMLSCAVCDQVREANGFREVDGETMCEQCAEPACACEYWGCDLLTFEPVTVDGEQWCQSHADGHAYGCDRCASMTRETCAVGGGYWCERCTESYATWCDSCEEYESNQESCGDGGGVVHSYSYRPEPVFTPALPEHTITARSQHGYRPAMPEMGVCSVSRQSLAYFGVELETEPRSRASRTAGLEAYTASSVVSDVYAKDDGSLSSLGVEWVTHPRTLSAWQSWSAFGQFCESLRLAGWRSWDTETCGLHVHASRAAFDGASHLGRLVYFFRRNEAGLIGFAGRSSTWADFSRLRQGSITGKTSGVSAAHYDALNLSNWSTVEFRIFKPSLRFGRVLASVELCASLIEYTRPLSALDMSHANWSTFTAYLRANGNTYPHALAVINGHRFNQKESI